MRLFPVAASLLLLISSVVAQKSTPNSLDDLRFLIGEWEGVGAGGPGAGKGVFSFAFDLQNKAIVRKRYRLTYRKLQDGTLNGKFEIAPPGQPEAFKTYLEWTARKK